MHTPPLLRTPWTWLAAPGPFDDDDDEDGDSWSRGGDDEDDEEDDDDEYYRPHEDCAIAA